MKVQSPREEKEFNFGDNFFDRPIIQYNRYNWNAMTDKETPQNRKEDKDVMQNAGRGYALGLMVFAISSQMFLFPLAGLWLDRQAGTGLLFAAIGLVIGMYAAISQLMRLK